MNRWVYNDTDYDGLVFEYHGTSVRPFRNEREMVEAHNETQAELDAAHARIAELEEDIERQNRRYKELLSRCRNFEGEIACKLGEVLYGYGPEGLPIWAAIPAIDLVCQAKTRIEKLDAEVERLHAVTLKTGEPADGP